MSPATSRSRLLRRVRRTLGLGTVGALALPLIAFSNAVEVAVDGELLSTRTYATTVGDVLTQMDLAIGPADDVSHDEDLALAELDGDPITVERAFTVDVLVDDAVVRRVTAPFTTVADVLDEAEMTELAELGTIDPPPWRRVREGDRVELTLPRAVHVVADGEATAVTTEAATVAEVLDQLDIELREDDQVDWDLDAEVVPYSTIRVERIDRTEEVDEVELPFEEERRETDDLERGDTEVAEPGTPGLRRDTYRVVTRDGEEIERELVGSEVVREPTDRVVLVGTRPPPPPPPPPPAASSSGSGVWDRLARCESGGNWSINTGNGYYGGLQFALATWRNVGGSGMPHEASKAEQIRRAEILVSRSGGSYRAHWPSCSRSLGLP